MLCHPPVSMSEGVPSGTYCLHTCHGHPKVTDWPPQCTIYRPWSGLPAKISPPFCGGSDQNLTQPMSGHLFLPNTLHPSIDSTTAKQHHVGPYNTVQNLGYIWVSPSKSQLSILISFRTFFVVQRLLSWIKSKLSLQFESLKSDLSEKNAFLLFQITRMCDEID